VIDVCSAAFYLHSSLLYVCAAPTGLVYIGDLFEIVVFPLFFLSNIVLINAVDSICSFSGFLFFSFSFQLSLFLLYY